MHTPLRRNRLHQVKCLDLPADRRNILYGYPAFYVPQQGNMGFKVTPIRPNPYSGCCLLQQHVELPQNWHTFSRCQISNTVMLPAAELTQRKIKRRNPDSIHCMQQTRQQMRFNFAKKQQCQMQVGFGNDTTTTLTAVLASQLIQRVSLQWSGTKRKEQPTRRLPRRG